MVHYIIIINSLRGARTHELGTTNKELPKYIFIPGGYLFLERDFHLVLLSWPLGNSTWLCCNKI